MLKDSSWYSGISPNFRQANSLLVRAPGTRLSTWSETKINTQPDCKSKTTEGMGQNSTEIISGSNPQLSNVTGTKLTLPQLNAPDIIKCDRRVANLMHKFLLAFPPASSHPEHTPTSRHTATAFTLLLACSINSRGAFPNWNAAPNQGIQLLMQGGELAFLSWNKTALTITSPRIAAKRRARAILPLCCLPQQLLRLPQHSTLPTRITQVDEQGPFYQPCQLITAMETRCQSSRQPKGPALVLEKAGPILCSGTRTNSTACKT